MILVMQLLPQIHELKATTSNPLSEVLMCRVDVISYRDALPAVLIIWSQYPVRVPLRGWSTIVNLSKGVWIGGKDIICDERGIATIVVALSAV